MKFYTCKGWGLFFFMLRSRSQPSLLCGVNYFHLRPWQPIVGTLPSYQLSRNEDQNRPVPGGWRTLYWDWPDCMSVLGRGRTERKKSMGGLWVVKLRSFLLLTSIFSCWIYCSQKTYGAPSLGRLLRRQKNKYGCYCCALLSLFQYTWRNTMIK